MLDTSDKIILDECREKVDEKYVGFRPNGDSIKPVHVANGAMRIIYGKYSISLKIKRLALVCNAKGIVPKGNELHQVYEFLKTENRIDEGIDENSLESLRNVMQKILSADKGVYVVNGLKDTMLSYTAGSSYFLTNYSMYEDAGEFIGGVIKKWCPDLSNHIKSILSQRKDSISLLFSPVTDDSDEEMEDFQGGNRHDELPIFKNTHNKNMEWFLSGLRDSGTCLSKNFKTQSNPLMQLRLFNFFCIFQLMRYMTMLETFYCDEPIRPILLDFSGKTPSKSSVARASEISYIQMHKAINRFYAWAYAQWLKDDGRKKKDLLRCEAPDYKKSKGKNAKATNEELDTLWTLAKERIEDASLSDDDARLIFGETMYDMLALQATSHPVNYLRKLCTSSGILYPPDNLHPNKRFVLSQDVLETLIRSCVMPGEVISERDIRERFWKRFGIIIGGSQFELDKIRQSGMIMQVDEDALETNFDDFATALESMDFAEKLADGILQIRLGGLQ